MLTSIVQNIVVVFSYNRSPLSTRVLAGVVCLIGLTTDGGRWLLLVFNARPSTAHEISQCDRLYSMMHGKFNDVTHLFSLSSTACELSAPLVRSFWLILGKML
jgi:hypothetical protein